MLLEHKRIQSNVYYEWCWTLVTSNDTMTSWIYDNCNTMTCHDPTPSPDVRPWHHETPTDYRWQVGYRGDTGGRAPTCTLLRAPRPPDFSVTPSFNDRAFSIKLAANPNAPPVWPFCWPFSTPSPTSSPS